MAVHWVNYDLNKTGQGYAELIKFLESHESWARPLRSSFFVRTTLTADQLRDGIMGHIDSNDQVVVVTVTGQLWASYGLPADVAEWLQNSI